MADKKKSLHVKSGDRVIITAGKDKGKTGNIKKSIPSEGKVVVEGINIVKKHMKPNQTNETGGILSVEAPIHVSNVKVIEAKDSKKETKKDRSKRAVYKRRLTRARDTRNADELTERNPYVHVFEIVSLGTTQR